MSYRKMGNQENEFQIQNLKFKNGGEDRTRTCKRFRAVVFKTTALPIRLPLRTAAELQIYRIKATVFNPFDQARLNLETPALDFSAVSAFSAFKFSNYERA